MAVSPRSEPPPERGGARLLRRLFRRTPTASAPDYADDGTLRIVVSAFDPTQADSGVLAAAAQGGVDLSRPLLVRHHLVLPNPAAVEQARMVDGLGPP